MKIITVITFGLVVAASNAAHAQSGYYATDPTPVQITPVAGHGPLVADNGMTLYTFDDDSAGMSNCYDSCATSWPPYLVDVYDAAPGDGFVQIARQDGTTQWAKDGAPLYFWVGDTAPGDTTGDGIGGVWHIAK